MVAPLLSTARICMPVYVYPYACVYVPLSGRPRPEPDLKRAHQHEARPYAAAPDAHVPAALLLLAY